MAFIASNKKLERAMRVFYISVGRWYRSCEQRTLDGSRRYKNVIDCFVGAIVAQIEFSVELLKKITLKTLPVADSFTS
jgi:hypothetical protein